MGDITFWLGTDLKGRDMLSRMLWGCQRVLVWGVTATAVAYVVGCIFGLIAGYISGIWDEIISFISNVLLSFPVMVLFILILNYLGPSGFNIVIAVTFASAPAIMRIVRGLALDNKTRDYVFAAQTRGEHPFRIMVWELLPNVRGPIIVDACLRLGYTTVAITTLTFLGLGLQPPDPDWGLMIKEASNLMVWKFSYMLLIPALAVSSLGLVGLRRTPAPGLVRLTLLTLLLQVGVGLLGFWLHLDAGISAIGGRPFEAFVHGAPPFAPLLFADLAVLAAIGLLALPGSTRARHQSLRPASCA
jgi:ABC-type dipeptide/oligopeptide/nickel transport system permease subunit